MQYRYLQGRLIFFTTRESSICCIFLDKKLIYHLKRVKYCNIWKKSRPNMMHCLTVNAEVVTVLSSSPVCFRTTTKNVSGAADEVASQKKKKMYVKLSVLQLIYGNSLQDFGSASISCGSGSRVLKSNAYLDADTDLGLYFCREQAKTNCIVIFFIHFYKY